VYVASSGGVVSRFSRRAKSGRLKLAGCIGGERRVGCERLPSDLLSGASGLAVAPNGSDVYVASAASNTITAVRATRAGGLRLGSCFAGRGRHDCSEAPRRALKGAYALATVGGDLYGTAAVGAAVGRYALR
jgi:hypothetical protein